MLGFKQHVAGPDCQTQAQPETGLLVVATTKHVEQTEVKLQPQNHGKLQRWPNTQDMNRQDVENQLLPQPLEPAPQTHKRWIQNPVAPESQTEVHSKAQSMARSRLEKTRLRLQGRIQQAVRLFGGKDISGSQAKKKQVQNKNSNSYLCVIIF